MRDGGTQHKCTAAESVSLQGPVSPCVEQIGLIIFQLCDNRKVAPDFAWTPYFFHHQPDFVTANKFKTQLIYK